MSEDALIDPESIFWRRIEDGLGDPLPRLLYADWCDENDKPIMSMVQRWLVATGHRAARHRDFWIWMRGREEEQWEVNLLPEELYYSIRSAPEALWEDHYGDQRHCLLCDSLRASEEALAEAWPRATSWQRLMWRFRPDFAPDTAGEWETPDFGNWQPALTRTGPLPDPIWRLNVTALVILFVIFGVCVFVVILLIYMVRTVFR